MVTNVSKYTVAWSVNNGSTYGKFDSNNLREAIKDANEICKGNVFPGNGYNYSVVRNEDGKIVHEVSKY